MSLGELGRLYTALHHEIRRSDDRLREALESARQQIRANYRLILMIRYSRDTRGRLCAYSPTTNALAAFFPVYVDFPEWDSEYTRLILSDPVFEHGELIQYDTNDVDLKPILIDTYSR